MCTIFQTMGHRGDSTDDTHITAVADVRYCLHSDSTSDAVTATVLKDTDSTLSESTESLDAICEVYHNKYNLFCGNNSLDDSDNDCPESKRSRLANSTDLPLPYDFPSFLVDFESQIGRKGQLIGYSPHVYQSILNTLPLLEKPMYIELEGTFTMYLDVNKRIHRIDLTNTLKVEPAVTNE